MNKHNFKNQVVVVTGGSGGIGKATAVAFVNAGAKVIIGGRDIKKLRAISKEIDCDFCQVNVENLKSVKKFVLKVVKKYKKIDVLINSAGIYGPIGQFHTNNLKDWEQAIKINLFGVVNVTHTVLPIMFKQKKGKIINLSGGGAVQPFPNFSAYATSKASVVRFTENLAKEYEKNNIQINAVAPGAINTLFLDQVIKAGEKKVGKDFYEKSLEQKKTGGDSPELAAELMLFLCSPNSFNITGKLIAAKWDGWKNFTAEQISKFNLKSDYTLRRIDNKYFKEV